MADSEASLRGFQSPRARRRERARRGGLESGRRRRELARGRATPHRRDRGEALALAYRVQQINREAFAKRFAQLREREGVLVSERGLETLWLEYCSCMKAYRAQGQDFKSTNAQRARALDLRGRARCTRTIQRAHKQLAQMGLLRRYHVKRGGSRAGQRDCLRICVTSTYVTPPSAAPARALRALAAGASRSSTEEIEPLDSGRENREAAQPPGELRERAPGAPSAGATPPDGGRLGGPAAPAGSEGGELDGDRAAERRERLERAVGASLAAMRRNRRGSGHNPGGGGADGGDDP